MNTLEKVRAKIIEAVPEIVEFKPGLLLTYKGELLWVYQRMVFNGEYRSICKRTHDLSGENESVLVPEKNLRKKDILGRPITLADVLRAIEKAGAGDVFLIYSDGGMVWSELEVETERETWNLALSYDEQTDEVKRFIGKRLGV